MNIDLNRSGKRFKPQSIIFYLLIMYILLTVDSVEDTFSQINNLNIYNLLEICYILAIIASECLCLIGFFSKNPWTWYSSIALLVLVTLKPLFYSLLGYDYFESAFEDTLAMLIFSVPIGIYYIKKKPLFFQGSASNRTVNTSQNSAPPNEDRYNTSAPKMSGAQYGTSTPYSNVANYSTTTPVLNGTPSSVSYSGQRVYCKHCGKPLTERDIGACCNCGTKIKNRR